MTGTTERLTREQAWEAIWLDTSNREPPVYARTGFYAGWDAALANSPLPQVVEALENLLAFDPDDYDANALDDAVLDARAALKAAKEVMGE